MVKKLEQTGKLGFHCLHVAQEFYLKLVSGVGKNPRVHKKMAGGGKEMRQRCGKGLHKRQEVKVLPAEADEVSDTGMSPKSGRKGGADIRGAPGSTDANGLFKEENPT